MVIFDSYVKLPEGNKSEVGIEVNHQSDSWDDQFLVFLRFSTWYLPQLMVVSHQ